MYAEIEQYITTAETVRSAHKEQYYAARFKYNANEITHNEMAVAQDAAQRTWTVATNEAWNALKSAADPLVSWIVDNCKDYQSQALEVLKALPATVEELDKLAADEDWCQIWDNFRAQAARDGAIDVPAIPSARLALRRWVEEESCRLSHDDAAILNRLVDAIVAEEGASE